MMHGPFGKSLSRDQFRAARRVAVAAGMTGIAVFQLCGWFGVRLNLSPSLPAGLYVATNAPAGLIEFCPGEPYASLAIQRGYRDEGTCPDGAMPLLKPIVTRSGDAVDVSAQGNRSTFAEGNPFSKAITLFGCYRLLHFELLQHLQIVRELRRCRVRLSEDRQDRPMNCFCTSASPP